MGENMTLLSQTEIDTLVDFLLEKRKESVSNEVLNQESIDRLIHMIRTTHLHGVRIKAETGVKHQQNRVKTEMIIREHAGQVCELTFEQQENGFLDIRIVNHDNNNVFRITPNGAGALTVADDGSQWGKCISPFTFVDIAISYDVHFTQETYQNICALYAEVKFGDKAYQIPDFFLPEENDVAASLLE